LVSGQICSQEERRLNLKKVEYSVGNFVTISKGRIYYCLKLPGTSITPLERDILFQERKKVIGIIIAKTLYPVMDGFSSRLYYHIEWLHIPEVFKEGWKKMLVMFNDCRKVTDIFWYPNDIERYSK